jgi:hypothetical protein
MVEVIFTVEVDGEEQRENEIHNHRASYKPNVALECAKSVVQSRFGDNADLSTVEVKRIGKPTDQYDETGSTGSPNI